MTIKENELETKNPLESSFVRGVQLAIGESALFTVPGLRALLNSTEQLLGGPLSSNTDLTLKSNADGSTPLAKIVFKNENSVIADMSDDLVSLFRKMFVSGDVGFGTNNPDAPVHIRRPGGTTTEMIFENTGSEPCVLTMRTGRVQANTCQIYFRNLAGSELASIVTDNGDGLFGMRIRGGSGAGNQLYLLNNGNVGIGTNNPGAKLDVNGTLRLNLGAGTLETDANGNVTASSDERMKEDHGLLQSATVALMELRPFYFKWKPETGLDSDSMNLGFSSQAVNKIIPEAAPHSVKTSINEFGVEEKTETWTFHDRPLLAYLVKGFQEQQAVIEQLKEEIELLKSQDPKIPLGSATPLEEGL